MKFMLGSPTGTPSLNDGETEKAHGPISETCPGKEIESRH
ncbi:hypothetical protein NBRC3257_0220 [Gluconobacter thailandicus NBRC 3257]|uniref:Uncharacterized protein n=1 Tax=Gluconobacter thailandicus NBRC 3257 TaxID=1381097 RepID=A0ABQ0ISP3_GLUTH|nr:hypothetical protein B932_2297 [Gluconobacter oxydans H24]GAC88331.1 hypothetical protein NBRC3255_1992 [Gluconobacter thailandicus NBRC 3255]GAD25222.1 hypothetical protein NBRC3257_0220 [Gluconobacter thailandicus NBRC 3257]